MSKREACQLRHELAAEKERRQCEQPDCPCRQPLPAIALDWHHLDPSKKRLNISNAISLRSATPARIRSEVQRCEVRCKVCHANVHG